MTTDSPERVSDERMRELLEMYDQEAFRGDFVEIIREALASRAEVEKLRALVEQWKSYASHSLGCNLTRPARVPEYMYGTDQATWEKDLYCTCGLAALTVRE